jgi:hypothetical protein
MTTRLDTNGQHIEWRMTGSTFRRFKEHWFQLDTVSPDSVEYAELIDLIRSLPGFPYWNNDRLDMIHIHVTDLE